MSNTKRCLPSRLQFMLQTPHAHGALSFSSWCRDFGILRWVELVEYPLWWATKCCFIAHLKSNLTFASSAAIFWLISVKTNNKWNAELSHVITKCEGDLFSSNTELFPSRCFEPFFQLPTYDCSNTRMSTERIPLKSFDLIGMKTNIVCVHFAQACSSLLRR